MPQDAVSILLIDTHISAILTGVVIGEILSFISFDLRLLQTMIRRRLLRPMPVAYLTARYSLLFGLSLLALFTFPIFHGHALNYWVVHWTRLIFMPLNFVATSAVLGYRALVIHYERLRLISLTIHLLLVAELIGGILVTLLSVVDPTAVEKHTKINATAVYVSPAWISAPLVIAIIIDTIFTLIVVIPILAQRERPKKGQVVHMLLSDATFFGIFSIVVKAVAIGSTVAVVATESTVPFLPVRVANVASTIFACRIFRSQEAFLQLQRERKADPSLRGIELETLQTREALEGTGEIGEEKEDAEKGEGGRKESEEEVRWKAMVTLTDCCAEEGNRGSDGNGEEMQHV